MKSVILCGGYAKRLWPLTKYTPKPLLDINGKPILDFILNKLENVPEIDQIFISTNIKFAEPFKDWTMEHNTSQKNITLILEPTKEEAGKFGTIAGIEYLIKNQDIDSDLLIIAGDNLFDFDINNFIKFYKTKNAPVVAVFDVKDYQKAQLYGIVSYDNNQKIIEFHEKPEKPESTMAATCCYIIPRSSIPLFSKYIQEGNKKDSPGFFIKWLKDKQNVYAFSFDGHWFDIGDFESLEKARKFMKT